MFRVKKRNHLLWRYLKPFQSPLLQMSLLISLLISIFHGKILIITDHSDRLSSVSKTCWTCFPLWDQFFYAMRWYSTFLSFPLWDQFCKMRDLSFSFPFVWEETKGMRLFSYGSAQGFFSLLCPTCEHYVGGNVFLLQFSKQPGSELSARKGRAATLPDVW